MQSLILRIITRTAKGIRLCIGNGVGESILTELFGDSFPSIVALDIPV